MLGHLKRKSVVRWDTIGKQQQDIKITARSNERNHSEQLFVMGFLVFWNWSSLDTNATCLELSPYVSADSPRVSIANKIEPTGPKRAPTKAFVFIICTSLLLFRQLCLSFWVVGLQEASLLGTWFKDIYSSTSLFWQRKMCLHCTLLCTLFFCWEPLPDICWGLLSIASDKALWEFSKRATRPTWKLYRSWRYESATCGFLVDRTTNAWFMTAAWNVFCFGSPFETTLCQASWKCCYIAIARTVFQASRIARFGAVLCLCSFRNGFETFVKGFLNPSLSARFRVSILM